MSHLYCCIQIKKALKMHIFVCILIFNRKQMRLPSAARWRCSPQSQYPELSVGNKSSQSWSYLFTMITLRDMIFCTDVFYTMKYGLLMLVLTMAMSNHVCQCVFLFSVAIYYVVLGTLPQKCNVEHLNLCFVTCRCKNNLGLKGFTLKLKKCPFRPS